MDLIVTNLISGALIFLLLFVYRLSLFAGGASLFGSKRKRRSQYSSIKQQAAARGAIFGFCSCCARSPSPTGSRRLFAKSRCSGSHRTFAVNSLAEGRLQPSSSDTAGPQAPGTNQGRALQGQERLRLQQISSSYGTYSPAPGHASGFAPEGLVKASTIGDAPTQAPAGTPGSGQPSSSKSARRASGRLSLFKSKKAAVAEAAAYSVESQRRAKGGGRGSERIKAPAGSGKLQQTAGQLKLQRRQSNGSLTSSTANLMLGSNRTGNRLSDDSDTDSLDRLDAISCSMSVASNSTSQLQGNDLYPIDCSIQFETTNSSAATYGPHDNNNNNNSATAEGENEINLSNQPVGAQHQRTGLVGRGPN